MSKGEKRVFLLVLAVLVAALTLMLLQRITGANEPRIYRVSVLLDGGGDDYSKNFRKGLNEAARDRNVDLRFVSRYDGDAASGQVTALKSEWQGETDGVILVPVDGAALSAALAQAPKPLAVGVVGPALAPERSTVCISADQVQMGAKLADAVCESGAWKTTLFLSDDASTAVLQRYEGFAAQMQKRGTRYERADSAELSGDSLPGSGSLVALDPATAEALCGYAGTPGRVYGIGASNRLLRCLEDGQAAALVVQSDYSAGYLSLVRVLEILEGKPRKDVTLDSYTVKRENMFTEPLVQMLFPIS